MRRSALAVLTSVFFLAAVSGCSLFKKKDPMAGAYDDSMDTASAMMADSYPIYQPATAPIENYPTMTATSAPIETTMGARYHTVAKKETLYAIARMYYNGDHRKWKGIYEANRGEISDPNRIRVGQRLVIP